MNEEVIETREDIDDNDLGNNANTKGQRSQAKERGSRDGEMRFDGNKCKSKSPLALHLLHSH